MTLKKRDLDPQLSDILGHNGPRRADGPANDDVWLFGHKPPQLAGHIGVRGLEGFLTHDHQTELGGQLF